MKKEGFFRKEGPLSYASLFQRQSKNADRISLENFASLCLYYYLFDGNNLRDIEEDLFQSRDAYHGYLSKCILNYYGVYTAPEKGTRSVVNRGIYHGRSFAEVVKELLSSNDPSRMTVAEKLIDARNLISGRDCLKNMNA